MLEQIMPVEYICHYCGKKAVLGEHRCPAAGKARRSLKVVKNEHHEPRDPDRDLGYSSTGEEATSRSRPWRRWTPVLSAVVGLVLVIAFLWFSAGAWALLLLPISGFAFVFFLLYQRAAQRSKARKQGQNIVPFRRT